jgi:hypothetical protein
MSAPLPGFPGITNPITKAGRVVYNADRDYVEQFRRIQNERYGNDDDKKLLYKAGHHTPECFTIQPYELCLRTVQDRYDNTQPRDTDIHVFSSGNQMFFEGVHSLKDVATKNVTLYNAREKLDFGGIASNRAIYDPDNNANESMCAVQFGGLQTIYNNNAIKNSPVNAGDIILWDLNPNFDGRPGQALQGIPREKQLFCVRKYTTKLLQDEIEAYDAWVAKTGLRNGELVPFNDKTYMHAAYEGPKKGSRKPYEVAKHRPMALVKIKHSVARRVIGKSMSAAKDGKPFDILLGHYCV